MTVLGDKGCEALVEEATGIDARHWRCVLHTFTLTSPTQASEISAFITAILNHTAPYIGNHVGIGEFRT
jgi:hypothetical protein